MRKLLLLCLSLIACTAGAWAESTLTWTSGVNMLTETNQGNANAAWFTVVAPFNGTISEFTFNIGTGNASGARVDAYVAISRDLKAGTQYTAGDFLAVSTNSIGTTDYEVTARFDNVELNGGTTYYFYFVTNNNGTYTVTNNRVYVATGQTANKMLMGTAGSTTATSNTWAIPFTCTMTLKTGSYYRIKGIKPNNLTDVYIYANSSNLDKLWKTSDTPTVTQNNYVWQATVNEGVVLQNMGTSRYISKFTTATSKGDLVNYLSATTVDQAEVFTMEDRVSYGKAGYVKLASATQSGSWLNTYTNQDNYVGCHNSVHEGDPLLFVQVKKVSFSEAVEVNGGEAVSTIYVAADGSDELTLPVSKLYSIGGGEAMTAEEAAAAIAATGTDDLTVTVSENPTKAVTYTLLWSDGTQIDQKADVEANLNTAASAYVPADFLNDFTTLTYSPETITNETTEVTVTATWAGPFDLSTSFDGAKWYTVGIHSYYQDNNHVWKVVDGALTTEEVPTQAYHQLTNAHCFAFTGNPYDGLQIWNAAAGETSFVTKANDSNTQASISTTATLFVPQASTSNTDRSHFACFQVKGGTNYLNCDANKSYAVYGWTDADNGSTCWFLPTGQYYLNFIDNLQLDAPVGTVGTSSYFAAQADPAAAKTTITNLRSTIADALYSDATTLSTYNGQLNPIREAATIELGEGYYRIVSANAAFVATQHVTPAIYYNQDTDKLAWASNALATQPVNSIVKLASAEGGYTIYSPNAQKYLKPGSTGQSAERGDLNAEEGTVIAFTQLTTAQYKLQASGDTYAIHANSHYSGTGTSGNLVGWTTGANEPSAWYIVEAHDIDLALNAAGDGKYYATLCLPFDVVLTGAEAYTLTLNAVTGDLTLSEEALTNVAAGTPVLLIGTAASAKASIATDASVAAPQGGTALTGVYTDTDVSSSASTAFFLGVNSDDEVGFYHWEGTTLKANRAYMEAPTSVKGYAIDFGTTTAVNKLLNEVTSRPAVYNLAGQRVSKAVKGIYVVGGRKVIK